MDERRGPRVKPTIETAGDIAYAGTRRAAVAAELRRRLEDAESQRARLLELEAWRQAQWDREWASDWIRDHGGTIAKALKRTHPDTGGSAADFQLTQKAREILSRQR